MKKLLSVVLAAGILFGTMTMLTSCGDKKTEGTDTATSKTTESDTLTMATNAEFPPFEYIEGDKVVGADVDIANAIAEKLGKKLEISNIDFDAALTGAATGKYDVAIAGITADDKRRKNMNFSDDYYEASQAIVVTKDSDIKSKDDLEGKTVSCQEGTTGEQYLNDNGYKVMSFKSGPEAISALTTGKVDALVIDNQVAKALSEKQNGATVVLDEPLTKESYAIALKLGNDELTDKINKALAEIKSEGKLAEIFKKYDLPYDAE